MGNQIKGITVEIGGDTTKLGKALENVNKSSNRLKSELKGVNSLLKMDPTNVTLLKQKQDILNESIEKCKDKLTTLKSTQVQVQAQFEKGEITVEQYRDFQREIVATETKLKGLTKEAENFGSVHAQQISNAGKKLEEFSTKIGKVGQKIMPISAGISALGTLAVNTAMNWETAFTGVMKTVDESANTSYADLKQGILEFSTVCASSAEEIAQVAENAGQLGIQTDNVMDFTKVMVMLGDSTNLTADEASSALAKLANITGLSADKYSNLGSTIVALGNNSATTEADIVSMASRLAGSATQVGITEQGILALATSLSSVGLEAEAGGTAISTVITRIDKDVANNANTLSTWAELSGMSTSQFKEAWQNNALSTLQTVVAGMGDASKGGENLNVILGELGITGIRESDSMKRLSNASELLNDTIQLSNTAWDENIALTEEAEKRYGTSESNVTQLQNKIKILAIEIGEKLLPTVLAIMEKISKLIDWFINLDDSTKNIIITIGKVVVVLGPVLSIIGKVGGAISKVMQHGPQIMSTIKKIKTLITGLFGVITAHPIVAIIVVIVGAFVLLWNKCEGFRNFWINLWETIKNVFNSAKDFIVKKAKAIGDFFTITLPEKLNSAKQKVSDFINNIIAFFTNLPNKIKTQIENLWKNVKITFSNGVNAVVATVQNFISNIINFFQQLPYNIGYIVGVIVGHIVNFGNNLYNFATVTVPEFIGKVIEFFTQLPGKILECITNAYNSIVEWGTNLINKAIEIGSNFLNNIINFFTELPGRIYTCVINALNFITEWGSNVIAKGIEIGSNFINGVINFFSQLPGRIRDAIAEAIIHIINWGNDMKTRASEAISELVDNITNTIKQLPNNLLTLGKDIVEGLWKGIVGAKDWIVNKVKNFCGSIISGFKDGFDSHSPARKLIPIGKNVDEGVAVGIEDNIDVVEDSTDSLVNKVIKSASKLPNALNMSGLSNIPNTNAILNKSKTTMNKATDATSNNVPKTAVINMIINSRQVAQATAPFDSIIQGTDLKLSERGLA